MGTENKVLEMNELQGGGSLPQDYLNTMTLTLVSSRTCCSSADSAPVNAAPVDQHNKSHHYLSSMQLQVNVGYCHSSSILLIDTQFLICCRPPEAMCG